MSGSSGLLGSALSRSLKNGGHSITKLSRSPLNQPYSISWDPLKGFPNEHPNLENFQIAIHLAGENLMNGRWTNSFKKRIYDSRITSTKLLSDAISKSSRKPELLICASAIGVYGHRGDEDLNETSAAGDGFLAGLCKDWEAATQSARNAGIRVVHLRTGIVLSSKGGALQKLLPAFRYYLGGKIGTGMQFMSWIHIDDWASAVNHIIENEEIIGPVNLVSTNPLTNNEFTKILASNLKRPANLPIPKLALKLLLGEMADEALLASQKVHPEKLIQSGFKFRFPKLDDALRNLIKS